MPGQARQNLGRLQRLEHAVAGQQNGVAFGHRPGLEVVIDFLQIVNSDETGERFALGMLRGFGREIWPRSAA